MCDMKSKMSDTHTNRFLSRLLVQVVALAPGWTEWQAQDRPLEWHQHSDPSAGSFDVPLAAAVRSAADVREEGTAVAAIKTTKH